MAPQTGCAPLPLGGRGWGWGSCESSAGGATEISPHHPPPRPSPTRGEGADRVRRSHDSTSRNLVRGHAARLDRGAPARDLGGHELGEIFGASALRRRDLLAERLEALAHGRRVERLTDGRIEAAYDRLGRRLGPEQAPPGAGFQNAAPLARSR